MKSRLHKTGTSDTYESHLRNHILSVFGKYGLTAIKPTMVQHWVKELQSVTGLAPATIETIYVIFASIMRGAVRDGYIRKTPCDDIRLPEVVATVVRLLTPVQVLTLADAMPRRYAPLVLLGAIVDLFRRDYYNREIWKPALAAAGLLPDTTFHDLRHTFASTALAEGVPISEVSRWPGHKSITTTVDLYGHLVPEASGRARDALDRAFTRR